MWAALGFCNQANRPEITLWCSHVGFPCLVKAPVFGWLVLFTFGGAQAKLFATVPLGLES